MINLNYGDKVSEETVTQIMKLLNVEESPGGNGIPGEVIAGIMKLQGGKALLIVEGDSIEEASRHLPDNRDETIGEAAILIRVSSTYRFLPKQLALLIEYFDSYPGDPKITWRYCIDSNQEHAVNILILKTFKIKENNETN